MVKYFSENMKIEPGMVAHICILRIPLWRQRQEDFKFKASLDHTVKCCVKENDKCIKSNNFLPGVLLYLLSRQQWGLSISVTRKNMLA